MTPLLIDAMRSLATALIGLGIGWELARRHTPPPAGGQRS